MTSTENVILASYDSGDTYRHMRSSAASTAPNQFLRELVQNGKDAGATEVDLIPSKYPHPRSGAKMVFTDNGVGMSPECMERVQGSIGRGARDSNGNFHVGARISTLFWNLQGVVFASWTPENPKGAFLISRAVPDRSVITWESPLGKNGHVGPVPKEWEFLKSDLIKEAGHGTSVMLLGNSPEQDTWGFHSRVNETSHKWSIAPGMAHTQSGWMGTKFYGMDPKFSVRVGQGTEANRADWLPDAPSTSHFSDIKSYPMVPMNRLLDPAFHSKRYRPFIEVEGTVPLHHAGEHVANVRYVVLMKNRYPQMKYLILTNAFGELHNGELYNFNYQTNDDVNQQVRANTALRHYGIREKELQRRTILIVEPLGNVAVDAARSHLTRNESTLPHQAWGNIFANNMPPELEALQTFAPKADNTEQENEWIKTYGEIAYINSALYVRSNGGSRKKVSRTGTTAVGARKGAQPSSTGTPRGPRDGYPIDSSTENDGVLVLDDNGNPVMVSMQNAGNQPTVELASNESDKKSFGPGGEHEGKLLYDMESSGAPFIMVNGDDTYFDQVLDLLLKTEGKKNLSKVKRESLRAALLDGCRMHLFSYAFTGLAQIRLEAGGPLSPDNNDLYMELYRDTFNYRVLHSTITNISAMSHRIKTSN